MIGAGGVATVAAFKIAQNADVFTEFMIASRRKAKCDTIVEAIKAKGLAEAEATEKKAEAMSKMKEAAVLEMFFKVLPDIAASVAKPLENIDKITMYGEGNTAKLVEDITKSTTQITTGLTEGLGFDLKSVLAGALGSEVISNAAEAKKEAPAETKVEETEDFTE
jgi:flotillin